MCALYETYLVLLTISTVLGFRDSLCAKYAECMCFNDLEIVMLQCALSMFACPSCFIYLSWSLSMRKADSKGYTADVVSPISGQVWW